MAFVKYSTVLARVFAWCHGLPRYAHSALTSHLDRLVNCDADTHLMDSIATTYYNIDRYNIPTKSYLLIDMDDKEKQ